MREQRLSSPIIALSVLVGLIALAVMVACLIQGDVGSAAAIGSVAVLFLGLAVVGARKADVEPSAEAERFRELADPSRPLSADDFKPAQPERAPVPRHDPRWQGHSLPPSHQPSPSHHCAPSRPASRFAWESLALPS